MSVTTRIITAAMLSAALASAPVSARSYRGHGGHGGYHHYHRGGGGIGVGGALLGAAILGGVAIAASNNNRDREVRAYDDAPPAYDEPQEYGEGARPGDEDAGPVADCSRAAERTAQARGGYARVTGIDRVDPIDGGANVLGTLEISHGSAAPAERLGWSCRAADGRVTGIRLG